MFKTAVILAGGEGQRMRPLTNYIPKALVEVHDNPLIQYSIDFLNRNGIKDIYITYGYKSELLFNSLNKKVSGFINTTDKGNSYFIFNSLIKYLNEPILVMPCDMVIDIDLTELYNDYYALCAPAIMMVGVNPVTGIDGDFIHCESNQRIININRNNKSLYYGSGLQVINPVVVNEMCNHTENFNDVWSVLMDSAEIKLSNIIPSYWKCYDKWSQII